MQRGIVEEKVAILFPASNFSFAVLILSQLDYPMLEFLSDGFEVLKSLLSLYNGNENPDGHCTVPKCYFTIAQMK